jgi:hypothetical protein
MKDKLCPMLLSYPNIIQLKTKGKMKTYFINNTAFENVVHTHKKKSHIKYIDLQRMNIWLCDVYLARGVYLNAAA